jgi:UDP-N-acetylmuramate--alanine ligase
MVFPFYNLDPQSTGGIHLVGIGGIGMRGLARTLKTYGYCVSGSDIALGEGVQKLIAEGIPVIIGQRSVLPPDVRHVIISSAICPDNPELQEANRQGLTIYKRGDVLAELVSHKHTVAISGTHGKTTTTALMGHLLTQGGYDPLVINGGVMHNLGETVRLGAGDWAVVEADESDGTMAKIASHMAVITNISPEHLDFYKTTEALESCFQEFLKKRHPEGWTIACADSPLLAQLVKKQAMPQTITYGLNDGADVLIVGAIQERGGMTFDIGLPGALFLKGLKLSLFGMHNVQNAAAVVAAAYVLGVPEKALRETLETFAGVSRRFNHLGTFQGADVIDDYAHHPEEIEATIQAARPLCEGSLIVVCEVHRHSRLKHFFLGFVSALMHADHVILAPLYTAGESYQGRHTLDELCGTLQAKKGSSFATYSKSYDDVLDLVHARAAPGDMILCLGAGQITQFAQNLTKI